MSTINDILEIHDKVLYQVVQSNSLIQNYSNDLTLNEKKLFLLAISKIKKDDDIEQTYTITFKEYCEVTGLQRSGNLYEIIKKGFDKIDSNSLWIYNAERKGEDKFIMFSHLFLGEGFAEFKFNKEASKHLFNLKDYFTTFELWNTLTLNTINSINLYEFFKSYDNLQIVNISVEDLTKKLNVNYKRYTDFKRFVLIKSIKEINEKTDLEVKIVNEIKSGRRVDSIEFQITNHDFNTRNTNFRNFENKLLETKKEKVKQTKLDI